MPERPASRSGVLLAVVPAGSADVGVVPASATIPVAEAAADGPDAVASGPAVAGTVPVAVALPDRHVSAPVVPTATGPDGALAVPDPPSTVGWWSPGALAGATSGTTVLVGHVDSAAAGLGVFAVLRDVAVGERVLLRGADGRTARLPGDRPPAGSARPRCPPTCSPPAARPRLALVTCGGRFDRATRHYTDNVVVYAVPA